MAKVIVILGPTASGKSELAVLVAKKINGEVISADSMQIYRELDVGTGKISAKEMEGISHHLISFKNLSDTYNVWQFVNDAREKIDQILAKGKTPIIVGGTNLYITALIKDYDFNGKSFDEKYISKNDLQFDLFALNYSQRSVLYDKINSRVDKMMEIGLLEEVKTLKNKGLTTFSQAGKSIGYKELLEYLDGQMSYEIAVQKIKQHSRNYAKRQLTWLRSMENLTWLDAKNLSQNIKKITGK